MSSQVSPLFISQYSGVSVPRSVPKSSSAQSLMTDRNSTHFLQTPANHSTDSQANVSTQAKAISRVTSQVRSHVQSIKSAVFYSVLSHLCLCPFQRQKSTPSKLISQSVPHGSNSDIQSKQHTICKQPLKKVKHLSLSVHQLSEHTGLDCSLILIFDKQKRKISTDEKNSNNSESWRIKCVFNNETGSAGEPQGEERKHSE